MESTTIPLAFGLMGRDPACYLFTLQVCRQSCNLNIRSDPADELVPATNVVESIPRLERSYEPAASQRESSSQNTDWLIDRERNPDAGLTSRVYPPLQTSPYL